MPRTFQVWAVKVQFYLNQKYWPNLAEPKSFNEKMQHRKLFDNNPLFPRCSDKYDVRDYIAQKVGAEHLIPLKAVVSNIDDLTLEDYGDNFVVKATHNSGRVHIVRDGKYDKQGILKNLKRTLNLDYGKLKVEPWYSKITPRIIVEELLLDSNKQIPNEYKFHIFKKAGKTTVVSQVDYDRYTDRKTCYYLEDGTFLDFKMIYPTQEGRLEITERFQRMLDIAKKLAEDFDYVRVDLYDLEGKIYCGELTFCHGSGFVPVEPREYDYHLGEYWELPSR